MKAMLVLLAAAGMAWGQRGTGGTGPVVRQQCSATVLTNCTPMVNGAGAVVPPTATLGTATNLAGGAAGQYPYQTGAGATGFRTPNTANGPVVLDASGNATIGPTLPTQYTIGGTLPAAAAGNLGQVRTVSNAADLSDCTVGGGTAVHECYSTGAAWTAYAGGGTTVNVNGSGVTSPNFNTTTPAAEAGYRNVKFQVSGSDVSAEVQATAPYSCAIDNDTETTCTHNLNTSQPWVSCYDASGNMIGGATSTTDLTDVVATSANIATLTFSGAEVGRVCVITTGSMGPKGDTGVTGAPGGACGLGAIFTDSQIADGKTALATVEGNCNLSTLHITSDAAVSATFDIQRVAQTSWTGTGTGTTIVGAGTKPVIAAATQAYGTAGQAITTGGAGYSGWTSVSLLDGDVVEVILSGVTVGTATRLVLGIKGVRP